MTTQQLISNLSSWLEKALGDSIMLKKAADFDQASAEGYVFKLVKPSIYENCLPRDAAEWTPDNEDRPITAPCVIVSSSGSTTISHERGWIETPVKFLIQTWHPGKHAKSGNGLSFEIDDEGWRDITSLTDRIVTDLLNAEIPGGVLITGDITCDLPSIEENEFYPYYRATISFSVSHARNMKPKFNI